MNVDVRFDLITDKHGCGGIVRKMQIADIAHATRKKEEVTNSNRT